MPAAAWVIGALSILIRLLNYLDTRIRLEGWEVELAVRAEAIRQFGDDAESASRKIRGKKRKNARTSRNSGQPAPDDAQTASDVASPSLSGTSP